MALQKQIVPVVFQGGLDQKVTDELVVPGNFLRLENCVRREAGKVQKRFGFRSLRRDVFGGGTITSGKKLGAFKNDLLLFSENTLYSYSAGRDAWINRGDASTVEVDNSAFVANNFIQTAPDTCRTQGLQLSIWEDSRGGVRTSILDEATGATILFDTEVSATGSRPRCFASNGSFILVYYRSSGLRSRVISVANPTVLGPEQDVLASGVSDEPWDLCQVDGFSAIYAINTTTTITVGYVYYNGAPGSLVVNGYSDAVTITADGANGISILIDTAVGIVYLVYASSSAITLKTLQKTLNGSFTIDTDVIETVADVCNIAQAQYGSGGNVRIWYEIDEASYSDNHIQSAVISCNGTSNTIVTAAYDFKRSVGLVSKGFVVDAVGYVVVAHDSALQPTYFVLKDDGDIVAKFAPSVGGGVTKETDTTTKQAWLSSVLLDDTIATLIAQKRSRVAADDDGTVLSVNVNLDRVSLDFGTALYNGVTLGNNYNVAGGVVSAYDGVSSTELGFHLYPEDVQVADGNAGTLNGSYRVQVTYEWVDGQGQIHRSAPSVSVTATPTNDDIEVTVPTLRLTAKTENRSDCQIVVYVTAASGTSVYYRAAEATNDPTMDAIVITVTAVDNTAEILYTVGGVLENFAPPSATVTTTHKNRMWLGGLEVIDEIAYSKEQVTGEGVQFSDLFRIKVDPAGGPVTALASLDDKLIIFKERQIYALIGNGPVETGAQNDYGPPQLITSDVGCDTPDSITYNDQGILFKAEKGIYLLDRSTNVTFVGAPVSDFGTAEITSAVTFADYNEVRFTTADSQCLVYNYYFNQWSTFSNYTAESAILLQGDYYHLKSTGLVNLETPDAYRDNSAKIKMHIETSWLAFAGIQGFQRIYYLEFLGEYRSAHKARIKFAYDYKNVYNETAYFNATEVLASETFGEDPFGDETPFGSNQPGRYQFRIKPRIQKCEAIKIYIEDLDQDADGGESVSLIGVTATMGVKEGSFRTGGSQTIG